MNERSVKLLSRPPRPVNDQIGNRPPLIPWAACGSDPWISNIFCLLWQDTIFCWQRSASGA